MALFHLSVTQTKRSAGQSAIASAAYRSGEKLYSEYYGEYSDYTRKDGVICSDNLLPSHAPPEYADRQILWNAVEKPSVERTPSLHTIGPCDSILIQSCGSAAKMGANSVAVSASLLRYVRHLNIDSVRNRAFSQLVAVEASTSLIELRTYQG